MNDFLQKHAVAIAVAIITAAIAWGTLKTTSNDHERRISALESDRAALAASLASLDTRLARLNDISASLSGLPGAVDNLRLDLALLRQRLDYSVPTPAPVRPPAP